MKFLCDQCKAKYQIADDKVAGKTVKMKCRKCGHMIEVRAAVTETSVSIDIPRDELNPPAGTQAPRAAASPARTGGGLATSLASARPAPPKGPARPAGQPSGPATGLAGAFTRNVQKDDDALDLLELHVTDEWYVAINGVPVGPVRIAELRRKAATGAVNEDSLVWQEGLEEWRPVKAISELAVVVREAAAGGRVSLATPPPGEARQSAPPVPPRPPVPRAPTASSFAPPRPATAPPPAPAARNNVVPITAARGPATAEKLEEAPLVAPPPPLVPPPSGSSFAPGSAKLPAVPDPFAAPPASGVGAGLSAPLAAPAVAPLGSTPTPAPAATKRQVPWLAIAMVVLAGAFGVTAAIILLVRTPQPQPVVMQVPSATSTTPPPSPATEPGDVPAPDPLPTASGAASAGKPAPGGRSGPKPATTTASQPAPTNSAIAALLGGANGPSPGAPSPGGSGGGGQLTGEQVERTVHNYQAGVRRTCFDRLATDKTGTVQVKVTATVGPSGSVQSASADGNDPMVAKCIEGAMRSWQFPATGSTTTVQIPFKFVRQ